MFSGLDSVGHHLGVAVLLPLKMNMSPPCPREIGLVSSLSHADSISFVHTDVHKGNILKTAFPQPVVSASREVCTPRCTPDPSWQAEIIGGGPCLPKLSASRMYLLPTAGTSSWGICQEKRVYICAQRNLRRTVHKTVHRIRAVHASTGCVRAFLFS